MLRRGFFTKIFAKYRNSAIKKEAFREVLRQSKAQGDKLKGGRSSNGVTSSDHSIARFFLAFLIRHFDRLCLPRTWLRNFEWQSRASLNFFLESVRICVVARVGDLAAIITSNRELFVAGVVMKAGEVFPANFLFAAIPSA